MEEVDRILYSLGYYNDDPLKKEQIEDFIEEANQFMLDSGVPQKELISTSAKTVRRLWVDARDKGLALDLPGKDKMILSLISQLKGRKKR